jgi:uncharacterized protein
VAQRLTMAISTSPQFVVKVSKYCNLRCDYCYEFSHLGDMTRVSLDQIGAAFQNIENSVNEAAIERADFIWHGGEPFLVPLKFYEQVNLIQKDVFGGEFKYRNSVQTNLTVLTDRHIEFLKSGFFQDIGVSFDVYGDQRVDTKGKSRTETVRANIRKLIDHRIDFRAIAVLARDTLPSIRQVYRFFDNLDIEHRILAYYRSASGQQAQRHGLDFDELVGAYEDIFHEWLASARATPVDPIKDYVRYAVQHVTGIDNDRYDRSTSERVFIVDVNGDVFGVAESYEPEFCYGNLFRAPFREIAASEGRVRSIALSRERVQRFCHRCPYFGNCPGAFVANATRVEREVLEESGCIVRAVLDHMIDLFTRTDLKDFILERYKGKADTSVRERPALSVA